MNVTIGWLVVGVIHDTFCKMYISTLILVWLVVVYHSFTFLPSLHYLSLSDPSLTPVKLSTVLDIMTDGLWWEFSGYVNIPVSERNRIREQCTSTRECKQALIHSFLSSHPAPSWTLVAWALYMTEYRGNGDGSCLRALDLLQQLFPTGTVCSCGLLMFLSTCKHSPAPTFPCRKIPLPTDLQARDETRPHSTRP